MKFDKEFKEAILEMPIVEKDKLLIRLLKKDHKLIDRLYFELIDTSSTEEQRANLEEKILKTFQKESRYFNGFDLKDDIRYLSGDIQQHLYVTKDKYGEVSLTLLLLVEALKNNAAKMRAFAYKGEYKLNIYIVNKIYKLLGLISKIHEDLHLDFKEQLEDLAGMITEVNSLMKTCINNGLDMNWLLGDIPDDIIQIPKDLRKQGFLK